VFDYQGSLNYVNQFPFPGEEAGTLFSIDGHNHKGILVAFPDLLDGI
jgi:hypothetical protein